MSASTKFFMSDRQAGREGWEFQTAASKSVSFQMLDQAAMTHLFGGTAIRFLRLTGPHGTYKIVGTSGEARRIIHG